MFYSLQTRQRGKLKNLISELNLVGEIFRTDAEVLQCYKHFSKLAS